MARTRTYGTLVAFLLASLLTGLGDAKATVIIRPPPPDFEIFIDIAPGDFAKMRSVLLDFGRSEGLVPVVEVISGLKDPPRAHGKQFFLSLINRNSDLSLLAEKAPGHVFHIECYELASGSRILPMATHLEGMLQKRWPSIPLRMESRWLQRNPPPPIHLIVPAAPAHLIAPKVPHYGD